MNLGFHQLEVRIIVERTTTCTTTQLRVLPLIIDSIGCDITIEDIQAAKRELSNGGIDLQQDINERQTISPFTGTVTPLIYFLRRGNLLIVKLLFLIGADCTKLSNNGNFENWFPMLTAVAAGHLDICQWLFKYGGDAKYQINKETRYGDTPLRASYVAWKVGWDNEGKTCRWLLLNGGGQHLSSKAMRLFGIEGREETNSNRLVLWTRENIQLYHTFILFLCGATTMITSSFSSEPNDGATPKRKRKRKIHSERSLQILDGHPGIMELIGDCVGVIRGNEFRMLKAFNELVIEYNNTYQSSSSDDDDDDDDDDSESTSDDDGDNDNDNENGEDEDEE